MGEIFFGIVQRGPAGLAPMDRETLMPPGQLKLPETGQWLVAGSGLAAYPELMQAKGAEPGMDFMPHGPLVCSSYYLKPEDRHWVWIFSDSPQKFLLRKIMLASRNATILAGPVILGLLLFHWPDGISILAVSVVGFLYLWAVVLAKYAAFPREFGLVQGALLGVGFLIPPLMVLVLAYFYLSASKKLQVILQ